MADVDLTGNVTVRDVFAQRICRKSLRENLTVEVPKHDTRIFILQAEGTQERTVYEAETAWLERFHV